jgi:hypothetical protein
MTLPPPQVAACYHDVGFMPPLPAMQLNWPADAPQQAEWKLPSGETLKGPPPGRFGVRVRRQAEDAYAVTLVWDSTYRQWFSLRRGELEASSLGAILEALGTPLRLVLDQPPASAA